MGNGEVAVGGFHVVVGLVVAVAVVDAVQEGGGELAFLVVD